MDIAERIENLDLEHILKPMEELRACRICPRNCNADRYSSRLGYCKADASFSISSIFAHQGEEPAVSGDQGICNVFFTHCNLQCIYCQNHQISGNEFDYSEQKMKLSEVISQVVKILDTGIRHVGFVSPSHFVPQVKVIIRTLRALGYNPVFVYNTNAYDSPDSLKGLENYIDVYLPDFKYVENELGEKLSDVKDYPDVALRAIREMVRQKGTALLLDDRGYALKGVIIRHLVLPGFMDNSIKVLRTIASELSNDLHISLMSQYYPTNRVREDVKLGRTLKSREYERVVRELEELGFENGWVQDLSSHESYRPDFDSEKPFDL